MIVWTSQPNTVYEQLQQNGIFICDPKQSEFTDLPEFMAAYSWMCEKMTQRIGPAPDGVKLPIWAWYRRHGKNKRPDMREMDFRGYKEPMVLMELEIPDNEVLLSDEMMWNYVIGGIQDTDPAEEQIRNNIFENIEETEWVQATFWVLKKEHIKKVWFWNQRVKNK